jgi:hypothetical protein
MKQIIANTDPQDVAVDRLIRDGRVAVLYSPGHGAGWSTWNPEHFEAMLFDPQITDIVDHAEEGWIDKVLAVAMMKYPDAYLGGAKNLQVRWLPVGTQFRVNEYDGNEELEIKEQMDWITA